ncbi:Lysine-specific demethylase 8 [Hondaea fermentalgiana]|uniref:Lysine-specific demethylase 8 n=1 Tax=Hondaea fermentalgiana TaxID=2315210 RepID=A0A2R5GK36_9STRA|nr:Lysine-specific demethylase 8 [Hondaea fermentalgiana]|eukprot:GBG31237.1 Lysine-specific demethylase 8 [Hondaea fermentalgiana]
MDLFADSSDEESPPVTGPATSSSSSQPPSEKQTLSSDSQSRKRPLVEEKGKEDGGGPEEQGPGPKRPRGDSSKDPRLAAATRAVVVRCRIFASQTVPATAEDLRNAVGRPELGDKLEAAVVALQHNDEDAEKCLKIADEVQDAAWKAMLSDRSTAHRCWKEAFVLSRSMMAAAALALGDVERCVENADLAFIMGAPKQEVNLIFRLVAPQCPAYEDAKVKGVRFPDRAAIEARGFDAGELRQKLSPGAQIEPLQGDKEVLDKPSLEDLAKYCLPGDQGRAVVIKGMVDDWPALTTWCDLDFFVSRYGNRRIPVEIGSRLQSMKEEVTKLGEFLANYVAPRCRETAENVPAGEEVAYLAQHNLLEQLPELLRMAPMPRFCAYEGATLDASSVWLGTDETVTLLHYDSYDNFLIQVAGAKYVVLFDGSQFEELYVSKGSRSAQSSASTSTSKDVDEHDGEAFLAQGNTSAVDVGKPDLEKYPKYAKAQGKCVVLQPGDTLYIPQGMWHYVRSLTPSLSVNYWFSRSSA